MVLILLAEGFEEIEALTPLDILRRAGIETYTVSVTDEKFVTGAHGIPVLADLSKDEARIERASLVIFPGGMPGSLNLDRAELTDSAIDTVIKNGGHLAAICAAPLILGRRGLLSGKKACCYPGFEAELIGAEISYNPCTTDGNITTARGMGSALLFSLELVSLLKDRKTAAEIYRSIMPSGDSDFEKFT